MQFIHLRFSLRTTLIAVVVAGIISGIAAGIKRDNEAKLRLCVTHATLQAKSELGELAAFDVAYQWTEECVAQVVFRPRDGNTRAGRIYQVETCGCGMKQKVTSSPLP
jgi:hypothetical protein